MQVEKLEPVRWGLFTSAAAVCQTCKHGSSHVSVLITASCIASHSRSVTNLSSCSILSSSQWYKNRYRTSEWALLRITGLNRVFSYQTTNPRHISRTIHTIDLVLGRSGAKNPVNCSVEFSVTWTRDTFSINKLVKTVNDSVGGDSRDDLPTLWHI